MNLRLKLDNLLWSVTHMVTALQSNRMVAVSLIAAKEPMLHFLITAAPG